MTEMTKSNNTLRISHTSEVNRRRSPRQRKRWNLAGTWRAFTER